jgi:hypothetical protein
MNKPYRHGDLIFKPLDEKPKGLKKLEVKNKEFVLALGEVTGHRHVMREQKEGDMKMYQDKEGRYILEIIKPTQLSHEEHKTLTFTPGFYIMENEREFDYFAEETKKVLD